MRQVCGSDLAFLFLRLRLLGLVLVGELRAHLVHHFAGMFASRCGCACEDVHSNTLVCVSGTRGRREVIREATVVWEVGCELRERSRMGVVSPNVDKGTRGSWGLTILLRIRL